MKTIRYFVLTHLLAVLAASQASAITSGEGKWEDEKGRSHLAVIVENPY